DRLVRARTGGSKAVLRVSHPRQSLEALFLEIVEQARAERLETSGAQHGGQTASFLRGEEESGDELIDRLVRDADEPAHPTPAQAPAPAAARGPDENLIAALAADEPPAPAAPAAPAEPIETSEVDLSVIDSLVEGPHPDEGERPR